MDNEKNIRVRELVKEDLYALIRLEESIFSTPWTLEQYEKLTESGHCKVYGLFRNSLLISYVSVAPSFSELEIYNVGTRGDRRGRGYACFLLQHTLNEAIKSGADRAVLEVREHNIAALSLYESLGFKPCGRRKRYYSNPIEDAIIYELNMNKAL